MDAKLERLLSACAGPLSDEPIGGLPAGRLGGELAELLTRTNGFIGFESALLVRGTGDQPGRLGNWNHHTGWRMNYGPLAEGLFFFAEDIFGTQFALCDDQVVVFDPETGGTEVVGDSLAEWAGYIVDDWKVVTGHPLAHQWQQQHGPLRVGQRLVPIQPFVLGGEFEIANLRVADDVQAMTGRGALAQALHDVPDGASIEFEIQD
ncbi:hypothetical protein [Enemella sp. A6]|uniref:hypothetical protein n=1 Tax=Enemella sp. A6 TaxID=3440152 RepID=UPI003EC078BE